eukprot:147484-Amorphochlora_amoeboformis.AAC.1
MGCGSYGALGDGQQTNRNSPVLVKETWAGQETGTENRAGKRGQGLDGRQCGGWDVPLDCGDGFQ